MKEGYHSSAWVCDGPIVQAVVGIAWGQVVLLVAASVGTVAVQYVDTEVPPEQGEKLPQEMERLVVIRKVEKHLPVRVTM